MLQKEITLSSCGVHGIWDGTYGRTMYKY